MLQKGVIFTKTQFKPIIYACISRCTAAYFVKTKKTKKTNNLPAHLFCDTLLLLLKNDLFISGLILEMQLWELRFLSTSQLQIFTFANSQNPESCKGSPSYWCKLARCYYIPKVRSCSFAGIQSWISRQADEPGVWCKYLTITQWTEDRSTARSLVFTFYFNTVVAFQIIH